MKMNIIAINEERALENHHMGIRFTDEKLELGADVANSYDWGAEEVEDWDGEYVELDGACAIAFGGGFSFEDIAELKKEAIEVLEKTGTYPYDYAYIISGTAHSHGEDDHEIIVENAEVVGIVEIEK